MNAVNLNIDRDKAGRNSGKYFQKGLHGFNINKTKALAMKDITKECIEADSCYTRNYVIKEADIISSGEFDLEYIRF